MNWWRRTCAVAIGVLAALLIVGWFIILTFKAPNGFSMNAGIALLVFATLVTWVVVLVMVVLAIAVALLSILIWRRTRRKRDVRATTP